MTLLDTLKRCPVCKSADVILWNVGAKWKCCQCEERFDDKPTRSFATVALDELSKEYDQLRVERAHVVQVLTTFRDAKLSAASVQPLFTLLDDLLDGPKEITSCLPQ